MVVLGVCARLHVRPSGVLQTSCAAEFCKPVRSRKPRARKGERKQAKESRASRCPPTSADAHLGSGSEGEGGEAGRETIGAPTVPHVAPALN